MRKLQALILLLLLASCAQHRLEQERNNLAGYPEPYKDGYVEGCNSGTKAAGNPYYAFKKDVMRFADDKLYAQGWTDGFNVCEADYQGIMRSMQR